MKIYNITLLADGTDITLKELPVKYVYKETKALGILTLFGGGLLVFLPLAYFLKIIISGEPLNSMAALPVVSVVFFPLFLLGLNLVKRKKELIISNLEISRSYCTLFKKEEWTEPVSAYKGILMRTDVQTTGERSTAQIYALDLLHEDPSKCIRLFKSLEYNSAFSKWREYCQLFSVPALEQVGKDKIIRRDAKVLGKALVDLVKDGETVLYENPPQQPEEVEIKTGEKGKTFILPGETEILLGKKAIALKHKNLRNTESKFEYSAIRTVLIDYSKSYKRWAWAIVIIERNSTHRSVFAHNLPYHILEWLQYNLIAEIIDRLPREEEE